MLAMKKAKMAALKDLIKQMYKMEANQTRAFAKDGVGPSIDEMADVEEDEEQEERDEGNDVHVGMPSKTSLAPGRVAGSSDEGSEDDEFEERRRAFMKRSNQAPVKGKTKIIEIVAKTMKPMGKMSKKG